MDYQVTTPAATSYNTVAELKTHLLLFGDTSYDAELQDILLAAEEHLSLTSSVSIWWTQLSVLT